MEVNKISAYDLNRGIERMDTILDSGNSNYLDNNYLPTRDSLTYTNGYYVNVTSIFIDIVGSSDMTDEHKRPTLAKIYRCFISESLAILNSGSTCREVNIHGDCVWGIFETAIKQDIDNVINLAARLNSMIDILNYKLNKKNYMTISIGIGIDYGRALMIKAGYSGSSINDVIWIGDVVNNASNLCNIAGRGMRKKIVISDVLYSNLNDHNKSLFSYFQNSMTSCYEGNFVDTAMNDWYSTNCK